MISDDHFARRLREACDGFEDAVIAKGLSLKTGAARRKNIASICRRLRTLPHHVTTAQLELCIRQFADSTQISYLTSWRQYCQYAGLDDVTADIARPQAPRRLPDPLDASAFDTLRAELDTADPLDRRDTQWVLWGAYCGLRAHEVAKIHGDDFRMIEGRLCLLVNGKGNAWDYVVIPPVLAEALGPVKALRGRYLYPARSGEGSISPVHLSQRITARARAVGVTMRFHQLRHLFGTRVHRLSKDLLVTMSALRHKSPKSTAGYAEVDVDKRATVITSLPGATTAGSVTTARARSARPARVHVRSVRRVKAASPVR